MVNTVCKVYHCMSAGNGGRTEDSKGLWENRRRVGGINPFPEFGAVAQPSICFIPDWLTSNQLL